MKTAVTLLGILLALGCILPEAALAERHSIGIGAHYFRSLDEIKSDDEFDEDGLGLSLSYRFRLMALLALQGEVQFFPDGMYFADEAYSMRGFLTVGRALYASLGAGSTHIELPNGDDRWSDTEYQLRAGVDLPIIPGGFSLDLHADYILADWDDIDDLDEEYDEDTLTFGATARFNF